MLHKPALILSVGEKQSKAIFRKVYAFQVFEHVHLRNKAHFLFGFQKSIHSFRCQNYPPLSELMATGVGQW